MKRKFIYILISAVVLSVNVSCSDDDLNSQSIHSVDSPDRNEFDLWLLDEFVNPYNIEVKYRMEDIEADIKYNLVPAEYTKSIILSRLIKHLWLEPYDEVVGTNFTRTYIPKVIHYIGSAGYNPNNTMVMGTAESGLKVTLYAVNDMEMDLESLTDRYFHTMHHEFAHIFHQTKEYDTGFKLISEDKYVHSDWNGDEYAGLGLVNGFITDYARSDANEDFVEIYSTYITNTPEVWNSLMEEAGEEGAGIINRKLVYVKDYMKNIWKFDMDRMRDEILRRGQDLDRIDWTSLD